VITHIRRKTLGTTEKLLDARPLQRWQALHGVVEHRLKVIKITGNLVEAEILGDALHAPRFGRRLECANQQLARVILVIGAGIVITKDGQLGIQPFYPLKEHVVVLTGMQRQVHPHRCREITRPHAAAYHHVLASDLTLHL